MLTRIATVQALSRPSTTSLMSLQSHSGYASKHHMSFRSVNSASHGVYDIKDDATGSHVQVRKQLLIATLGAVGRVSLNANFRNAAKFEYVSANATLACSVHSCIMSVCQVSGRCGQRDL